MTIESSFSFGRGALLPQEETLELYSQSKKKSIGIVKESDANEHRVPLTPQAVQILVAAGHKVFFERDAALHAHFSTTDYSEVGAIICDSKSEVFQADIMIKVAPFTLEDIALLRHNHTIFSSFLINDSAEKQIAALTSKKITAIGFDYIRDAEGNYPVTRSMSEIAGTLSVLVAAEYLSNSAIGKGVLLGGVTGISPSEVVILGATVAGEFAARAALGMGAYVKVFDSFMQRLIHIQHALGSRIFTSNYHTAVLTKALKSAEVVIGTIQLTEEGQNFYVSEEMVKTMKKGAVIVDLSIDQGGCFETSSCTTHENPIFSKYGVTHYCVPNISSRSARTASIALSNIMMPMILKMSEMGEISKFIKHDYAARQGAYLYNGILTNKYIGEKYGLIYKNIDLLMAAF